MKEEVELGLIKAESPEKTSEIKTRAYQPGKEWLGYVYQLLFIASLCLNQFFSKVLFKRHPSLNPAKLITVRNIFAMLIVTVLMNRDFKRYMFDSVPRS